MVTTYMWNYIHVRYPWEEYVAKRIVIELVATCAASCATMVVLTTIELYFFSLYYKDPRTTFQEHIVITLVMNLLLVLTFEAIEFFKKWKSSLVENERLALENVQSQYESLKNQVNPHFLFNSLNALSGLIHTDQDKAEEFVTQFAKVYRYVLEVQDKQLVELRQEVDFIHAYLFLQQIRFGNNLRAEISIPAEKMKHWVPPLTLEILVENAIKHNQISAGRPLHINIRLEDDNLIVENNLQLREEDVPSTGVGLKNLRDRYTHFTGSSPSFEVRAREYLARVPLIEVEAV